MPHIKWQQQIYGILFFSLVSCSAIDNKPSRLATDSSASEAGSSGPVESSSPTNPPPSVPQQPPPPEVMIIKDQYIVLIKDELENTGLRLTSYSFTSEANDQATLLESGSAASSGKSIVLLRAARRLGAVGESVTQNANGLLLRDYTQLPMIAVKTTNIEAFKVDPLVAAVIPVRKGRLLGTAQRSQIGHTYLSWPDLENLHKLAGATASLDPAKAPVIGIIDSGIDHRQGGGIFGDCGKGKNPENSIQCRIKKSVSFVQDGREPTSPDAKFNAHGTVVAATAAEVSPFDVGLASLEVVGGAANATPSAAITDVLAAINWALCSKKSWQSNQTNSSCSPLNFAALNISIGFDFNPGTATCDESDIKVFSKVFRNVLDAGIIPVIAAGNSGQTTAEGLLLPACAPDAYSVGAVTVSPGPATLAPFSNVSGSIRMLAPGANIQVEGVSGSFDGTSYAAAYVSGAIASLAAIFPGKSAEELLSDLDKYSPKVQVNRGSGFKKDLSLLAMDKLLTSGNGVGPSYPEISPEVVCGTTRATNCYDNVDALAQKKARTSSGKILALSADGIWIERGMLDSSLQRVLKADGTDAWSVKLTPNGRSLTSEFLNFKSNQIVGRACPVHVMTPTTTPNEVILTTTNTCLYYDAGSQDKRYLWSNGSSQAIFGTIGLLEWSAPGTGPRSNHWLASWYEGNIQFCATKGMRLPALYETTAADPGGDFKALDATPIFARVNNGVPDVNGAITWTASGHSSTTDMFWAWSGNRAVAASSGAINDDEDRREYVRCVIP